MKIKNKNSVAVVKSLKKFKRDYLFFEREYNLPDFDSLNKDFQIEELYNIETDFLIKEIRKIMTNKFFDYLKFIESLINPPAESPIFVFSIIKKINNNQKEILTKIYQKISSLEFDVIRLDLNYSEIEEANSVIKYYSLWQEIKKDLAEIFSSLEKNIEPSVIKNDSYLG